MFFTAEGYPTQYVFDASSFLALSAPGFWDTAMSWPPNAQVVFVVVVEGLKGPDLLDADGKVTVVTVSQGFANFFFRI